MTRIFLIDIKYQTSDSRTIVTQKEDDPKKVTSRHTIVILLRAKGSEDFLCKKICEVREKKHYMYGEKM